MEPLSLSSSAESAESIQEQLPAIKRKHILTGAMGTCYFRVVLMGIIVTAFIRTMGLSPYRTWGMTKLFASFAVVLQMLGAHLGIRWGRRRPLWFVCAMASRLFVGLAVLAAYVLADGHVLGAMIAFVFLISLGKAFESMASPVWQSWFADLIPAGEHGHFVGRRSVWTSLAAIALLVPSAAFIDLATARGMRGPAFLVVFAAALALGYLDLFIHKTIPEPEIPARPKARIWPGIATALRDASFRPWLVFRCTASFAMGLGGSMTLFYILDQLGYSRNLTAAVVFTAAVPMVSTMVSASRAGRLIDKAGTRPALTASFLLISLAPMFWFFVTKETSLGLIVAWQFVFGIAANTSKIAGSKLVTRLPEREDCAMYVAVSNCLQSLAMGLGAFAAGEILSALAGWESHVAGRTLVGFHVLYLISTALRLTATALARFLPAPKEERALARRAEAHRVAARASGARA